MSMAPKSLRRNVDDLKRYRDWLVERQPEEDKAANKGGRMLVRLMSMAAAAWGEERSGALDDVQTAPRLGVPIRRILREKRTKS